MSWSDEEIDSIFQEANLAKEMPTYQDSYFDEIEHLLPKNKSKKGLYWFLGGTIGLVVSSILFITIDSDFPSSKIAINAGTKVNAPEKIESINSKNSEAKKIELPAQKKSNLNPPSSSTQLNKHKQIEQKLDVLNSEIFDNKKGEFVSAIVVREEVLEFEKELWNEFLETSDVELSEINKVKEQVAAQKEREKLEFFNLKPQSLIFDESEKEILALNLPQLIKKNIFYVDLSLGFSESFAGISQNELIQVKNQVYKTLSFGTGYKFNRKDYALEFGVNVINYQISDLVLNRKSRVYGFDVKNYSQAIDYKSITNIELPMMFIKKIKNQGIGVGLVPSYSLGSTINFSKMEDGLETANQRNYFNKIGINNFGLRPQVSYSLLLKNNFEIGTRLSVNLINPLKAENFENVINNNPFQAQITLRKNFNF